MAGNPVFHIVQQADHANGGSRIDRAAGALVVEGDVAASDRSAESAAGIRNSPTGLAELKEDLGFLRVPEIEAVGDPQWSGPARGHVAGRLCHGSLASLVRIEGNQPGIAVHRHGNAKAAAGNPDYTGIGPWREHRGGLHCRIVLLVDPALAGDVRIIEKQLHGALEIDHRLARVDLRSPEPGSLALFRFGVIDRAVFEQPATWNGDDRLPVVLDSEHAVVGHSPDLGCTELPFGAYRLD